MKSPQTFTERVEHLLEHVQYRRMEREGELEAVLRLRYNAYLKEGAITPNDSQKLEDAFDEGDNVYNIGIFIDGELASALRLHTIFHAEQESPAMESFSEFLIPELKAGRLIVDPNRFVANYALARLYPELPYVTLRPTHLACVHFGIDLVTMTVRGEHHAFYRRGFFANPVCPPRPYPLLSKPIGLLFVDFSKDAERILRRHPYWDSSEAERPIRERAYLRLFPRAVDDDRFGRTAGGRKDVDIRGLAYIGHPLAADRCCPLEISPAGVGAGRLLIPSSRLGAAQQELLARSRPQRHSARLGLRRCVPGPLPRCPIFAVIVQCRPDPPQLLFELLNPFSSARARNSPGPTMPRPGRRQRSSASAPTMCPVFMFTCG